MSRFNYVYVLRSQVDRQFYVGMTRDLRLRLAMHNDGKVSSTRHRRRLDLVYYEASPSESDAARRERYLKTAWGKRFIKSRLKDYLMGYMENQRISGSRIISRN